MMVVHKILLGILCSERPATYQQNLYSRNVEMDNYISRYTDQGCYGVILSLKILLQSLLVQNMAGGFFTSLSHHSMQPIVRMINVHIPDQCNQNQRIKT